MKRFTALLLTTVMCLALIPAAALAFESGEQCVTIGADLTQDEITQIYADFGIERGTVAEITVTNEDERSYLEGIAPEGKIGHVALSCAYIVVLEEGAGLSVKTKNINWCTETMYKNALTTAGITDAYVMISAPKDVSGTGALTGIYKAYEAVVGADLSTIAKAVGVEELVTTGELAEFIGSDEATALINELKGILDITQNMTDEEVRAEIKRLAEQYNVAIDDAMTDQLLTLCRNFEKLDTEQLRERLLNMAEGASTVAKMLKVAQTTVTAVSGVMVDIGNWILNLFGGK